MHILSDGMNVSRHASDYTISMQMIRKGDTINIKIEKSGGWIAILSPEKN